MADMTNAQIVNRSSLGKLHSKLWRSEIFRRILSISLALVITLFFALICVAVFFKAKNIVITGNNLYSSEELLNAISFRDEAPNLFAVGENAVETRITAKYPYIKDVKLTRKLPSTLIITVYEDAPIYYTDILGEYFVMTSELRITQRYKVKSLMEEEHPELLHISLPTVSYAIVGRTLEFNRDANYDYITELLRAINASEIGERVNYLDASDKFHISLVIDSGAFKLMLGDNTDLETKLTFARQVIDEQLDEGTVALINVEYTDTVIVTLEDKYFEY